MKQIAKKILDNERQLQKHIDQKNLVRITRTFNGTEINLDGFILAMSEDLLLIQLTVDFHFDGYGIIRRDQISYLRSGKNEKFFKSVLKVEGLFAAYYGCGFNIDLSNWCSVFTDLRQLNYNVIIEREGLSETHFDIGPIKRILKTNVSIKYHDPAGVLEEGLTIIPYADITILKFADRYSTVFKKYLKTS